MRDTGLAVMVMLGVALMASGCSKDQVASTHHPATLTETGVDGIKQVTLEQRAVERVGIETAEVTEERVTLDGRSVIRKVVPYGALMYDTNGGGWVFTNPEPLTYVRHPITVEKIQDDRVILSEGPPAGTVVVTVGAAELMGAEHNFGH